MNTRRHTLTASLIALLAAGPAFAQQDQTGQTDAQAQQQTKTGSDTAQSEQSGDREMPEAATPQGHGTSDLAEVDRPAGEIGPDEGDRQGQMVMLDIEGFSHALYERGFRQGYIRGISDARERIVSEMRDAQAARMRARQEGLAAQEDRMESAAGGQTMQPPGALDPSMGGEPLGQIGQLQPEGTQGSDPEQMSGGGMGEGGAIIVLPPGMTPQTFIDRVMEMNEAAQR